MNPVVQEEIDFLRYPQDMVALGGEDQGWLFQKIEQANSGLFTDKACFNFDPRSFQTEAINFSNTDFFPYRNITCQAFTPLSKRR
jgi:hypothetical protein